MTKTFSGFLNWNYKSGHLCFEEEDSVGYV